MIVILKIETGHISIRNICFIPLLSKEVVLGSALAEAACIDDGSVLVMSAGADVSIGELLFRRSSIEGTPPPVKEELLQEKVN